ncbi:uncharacterized protein K02A2.6-like [Rhagoletis pomonella]|uniref:uncharacterized protein K02A2.6-like n=1 Tax=Rhagoletis pomonella TaxID=28610 RepID=UPI001785A8EC|nr:uncharacterized protein K02A2.6-like [Rhagoletis pomonella]
MPTENAENGPVKISTSSFTVRSPDAFTFSNPGEWPRWLRRFERFRIASKLDKSSEDEQINTLVYLMGDQADNIFLSFTLSAQDKRLYAKVVNAFTNHFVLKTNVIYERAKFNLRNQLEGELIEDFITDLYLLSENCNYGTLREEMIRDKIVVGVRDRKLSEKLQLVTDLTLEKAVAEVRQHQAVRKQQIELTSSIHKLTTASSVSNYKSVKQRNSTENKKQSQSNNRCMWCGSHTVHVKQINCPAKGKKCNKCNKFNHFASVCLAKDRKSNVNQMHTVDANFLGMLSINNVDSYTSWNVNVLINKVEMNFMVDTGSPVDVISHEIFKNKFRNTKLNRANRIITGPDGRKLNVVGKFEANLKFNGTEITNEVYVIDGLRKPLLSLSSSAKLRLISKSELHNTNIKTNDLKRSSVDIHKEYPMLFNGLGCFKKFECEIKIKRDAKPFQVFTARRVPIALKETLRKKLDEMVKLNVIKKVDEPTPWCAPLVIVPKNNGEIRLCVDLTKLNSALEREIHPMPVADHTLAQLSGAKLFSKLDANSGFWQIKLNEKSQPLTTFLTPFGRYWFLRLPFGISSAPEIYQKRMQIILQDITGVVCQMDDILVFGAKARSHDEALRQVLNRLKENGATLNKDKCEIGITSLKFLGHYIDAEGIRPGDSKLKAIEDYPTPTNITELKRFLGMVNYLGKFIPFLSDLSQPLNELLRGNIAYQWDTPQETSFNKLKEMLIKAPVLKLYDPRHKTILSSDASSYGLGSVLLQVDENETLRPVAYASRTLSQAERGYAQIEKEALAITWAACEKFPELLTGIDFFIETDHKPLIAIFTTKNLDELTPRLQRFRMRMMRYVYDIYYTAGKYLAAADALSRHPLDTQEDENSIEEDLRTFVNSITSALPVTHSKLDSIRKSQSRDGILTKVASYCLSGWPDRYKIEPEVRPYYHDRYNLSVNDEILMHSCSIVIPVELRREILERIHAGHMGVVKCKARAKECVWWPGYTKDIEDYVKKCSICIQNVTPRRESCISTETPERPWQVVGIDLFYHNSSCYLIASDYFSRYPEIARLENQTTNCVINHIKSIFCRHGVPEVVRSDNGSQFQRLNHSAFAMFAKQWGFQHITSSPRYPQSNGFIESMVKTVKSLLKKNEDPYLALMEYRSTPLANGLSPSEMVMGRKIRTTLITTDQQLLPKFELTSAILKDKTLKTKQAENYNRRHGVIRRESFKEGDVVWVRDLGVWGKILKRGETPRSYIVFTDRGNFRRTSFHLVAAGCKDLPYVPGEIGEMTTKVSTTPPTSSEAPQTDIDTIVKAATTNPEADIPRYVTTTRSGRVIKQPERFTS